ncbi:MAG: PCRF domain-containing protein, partial [Mesorhizobium sp.]
MRLPQARLDQVLDRFREIEARMGAATDGPEIVRLGKEHAELKPVADAVLALERVKSEAPELEEMAAGGDAEMAAMARDELEALKDKLPALEHEVALLL